MNNIPRASTEPTLNGTSAVAVDVDEEFGAVTPMPRDPQPAYPTDPQPPSPSSTSSSLLAQPSPQSPQGHDLDRMSTTGSGMSGMASNMSPEKQEKRDKEWREVFEVDEFDELIESHSCAVLKDILIHGRIFISTRAVAFKSNILGFKTKVFFPLSSVTGIRPEMTAKVIPNAIALDHEGMTTTFSTLNSRDSTLDTLLALWRAQAPEACAAFITRNRSGSVSSGRSGIRASLVNFARGGGGGHGDDDDGDEKRELAPRSSIESAPPMLENGVRGENGSGNCAGTNGASGGAHPATTADTESFAEKTLSVRFPTAPEKLFNLIYHNDDFLRTLWEKQGFTDVKIGEWENGKRSLEYTKPLKGSVGPSSAKCYFTEEIIHEDPEQWYGCITTTKTPDVPSGKSFEVVTKTVLNWAGGAKGGTSVVATSQVDWSGRSMLKSVINSSSMTGQKEYNKALSSAVRAHIKTNHAEFAVPGETQGGPEVDDEIDDSTSEEQESLEVAKPKSLFEYLEDPIRTTLGGLLILLLLYNLISWLRAGHGGQQLHQNQNSQSLSRSSAGPAFSSPEIRSAMDRLEILEREWEAVRRALLHSGGGSVDFRGRQGGPVMQRPTVP